MSFHETLFKPTLKLPEKNVLEFIQSQEAIERSLSYMDTKEILYEIDERRAKLPKTKEAVEGLSDIEIRAYSKEADTIKNALEIVKRYEAVRTERIQQTLDGLGEIVAESTEPTIKDKNKMTENTEMRAIQKYLFNGVKNLTEVEERALDVSGAAVVIPTEVANKLIQSSKYSDLLYRSTQITDFRAGAVNVPIASDTSADWKIENSSVNGSSVSYEKSPTLTALELGGREIMRIMRMSAASASLSADNFENAMLQLLGNEVIATIEKSMIDGNGTTAPKGLANLTYTAANKVLTASAATPIAAVHVAEALSLLPQRYAKNAVVLVNAKTLFNMSQFKGTSEYAYNLSDGAQKFLGKEIVVNEHVADNTIFILDPAEIYVRWAAPLQMESNRSSGFTAASIDLRALAVCDFAVNPAAVVSVGLGA